MPAAVVLPGCRRRHRSAHWGDGRRDQWHGHPAAVFAPGARSAGCGANKITGSPGTAVTTNGTVHIDSELLQQSGRAAAQWQRRPDGPGMRCRGPLQRRAAPRRVRVGSLRGPGLGDPLRICPRLPNPGFRRPSSPSAPRLTRSHRLSGRASPATEAAPASCSFTSASMNEQAVYRIFPGLYPGGISRHACHRLSWSPASTGSVGVGSTSEQWTQHRARRTRQQGLRRQHRDDADRRRPDLQLDLADVRRTGRSTSTAVTARRCAPTDPERWSTRTWSSSSTDRRDRQRRYRSQRCGSTLNISGTIYAATANVKLNGSESSAIGTQLICYNFQSSTGRVSAFTLDYRRTTCSTSRASASSSRLAA